MYACTTHTCMYAPTYLFLPLVFWHFQVCSESFNMNCFSSLQWGRCHLQEPIHVSGKPDTYPKATPRIADMLTGSVSVLSLEGGNRAPGVVFRGPLREAVLAGFTLWGLDGGGAGRTGDHSCFWRKEAVRRVAWNSPEALLCQTFSRVQLYK